MNLKIETINMTEKLLKFSLPIKLLVSLMSLSRHWIEVHVTLKGIGLKYNISMRNVLKSPSSEPQNPDSINLTEKLACDFERHWIKVLYLNA